MRFISWDSFAARSSTESSQWVFTGKIQSVISLLYLFMAADNIGEDVILSLLYSANRKH